ncbi:hypothetical protein CC85DRAFT_287563 [Cutaneotrichosporon oleaginosum]|uniref:WSC domain-containing protein n=1 Tax=Cutaneotrichosporon oleaginosum TaxID=879819 RepID=A0A0J0XH28_9TREE|nr:uncharacterized protein CC85DRAFT_287563 [Cutaneotrichosporon oleaginosum]KLT40342.1 hypothetical protein CC85DRAFT_287563 [Cutaneotrichosporon oleaginosum]TXT06493.1 hypothetical protein COLE_05824 [Cutaneotrichosporon oleaginosum]
MALVALFLSGALAAPAPMPALYRSHSAPAVREAYYGDVLGLSPPPPLLEKRALLPAGWSYAGCVSESNGQRLLQGFAFSSDSNSASFCINECARRGFAVAGTEWGRECYCANSFTGNGGTHAPDDWCSMPCTAEPSETCGNAWYLSLYTFNSTSDGSLACGQVPSVAPLPSASPTSSSLPSTPASDSASTSILSSTNPSPSDAVSSSQSLSTSPSTASTASSASAAPTDSIVSPSSTPSSTLTSSTPSSTLASSTPLTSSASSTSATSSPIPSSSGVVPVSTDIPQSDEQHLVWAHHMVGNTYSYSSSDWEADISAAAAQAIDGFALNIGIESWQTEQAAVAYRISESQGGSFKMFLSLDMTSLPCRTSADAERLVNVVQQHAGSSAQAKFNGDVLVSTFAGSDCTFGTGTNDGWQTAFVDPLLRAGVKIAFIPSVFMSPDQFPNHLWMDGEFNWNSAWPMGNYDINTASDTAFRLGLGGRAYMTAVSPFFFTHFGANSWNKNWIYRSDNWLYCTRWEQIIAMRGVSTMTEILTWNDYGESSYIGPIRGSLPATSERWVNGFDHTALAPITKYYATAYKTGSYPPIEKDQIIVWARPHSALATAPDPVGRPAGYDWTEDNLYAVVFATAPAVATLTSGGTSISFNVPAGLSKIKMPLAPGSIGGAIERGGQRIATYDSGALYSFTTTPAAYNYNYLVGSS